MTHSILSAISSIVNRQFHMLRNRVVLARTGLIGPRTARQAPTRRAPTRFGALAAFRTRRLPGLVGEADRPRSAFPARQVAHLIRDAVRCDTRILCTERREPNPSKFVSLTSTPAIGGRTKWARRQKPGISCRRVPALHGWFAPRSPLEATLSATAGQAKRSVVKYPGQPVQSFETHVNRLQFANRLTGKPPAGLSRRICRASLQGGRPKLPPGGQT